MQHRRRLPLAPFAAQALFGFFTGNFGETVVLGADPDIARGAVLGLVLVEVRASRRQLGGEFSVDTVGQSLYPGDVLSLMVLNIIIRGDFFNLGPLVKERPLSHVDDPHGARCSMHHFFNRFVAKKAVQNAAIAF